MSQKYVIADIDGTAVCGYAWNSPIEGWCMTIKPEVATIFNNEAEAKKAIEDHYKWYGWKSSLVVIPQSSVPKQMPIGETR